MKKYISFFMLIFCSLIVFGQKIVSLAQAEESLQKNNLLLLAEQYNISASKAAVIQAKIWEQPFISGEFNAINPQDNKIFSVGNQGQKTLAIQQLIYLGAKKKHEVNYAKSNVQIEELQFEQLVRNLKYQLTQNYYSTYFDLQKIKILDVQINKLDTLLTAYQIQADKGNVPLKEVVRLQSLVLNLKNDKSSLQQNIIQEQQQMALITGITENIIPEVNENIYIQKLNSPKYSKEELINISLEKNPEYLTSIKFKESQDLFLKWQKSLSTPDITTGLSYDQNGGAFKNQVNITFGIPIPFWNKNKGNIQMAEAQVSQSEVNKNYKKQEIENNIQTAWNLWEHQKKQFNDLGNSTEKNLQTVYKGVISNFEKRNITLLEFTDFMDSYNQTTTQINEIKKQWTLASLQLNYLTNIEIFNN